MPRLRYERRRTCCVPRGTARAVSRGSRSAPGSTPARPSSAWFHGSESEFTALGDPINVAAHVMAQAGTGEVLVTDAAVTAAGLELGGLERRHLSLKGTEADVVVMTAGAG